MSTDTALIEKREELKRRLAAGEYKTLVDVFLEWFDRLVRKIAHISKPLPLWYLIIIVYLAYYLMIVAVIYIEGSSAFAMMHNLSVSTGAFRFLFVFISTPAFFIISMIIINQYLGRIFNLWREDMLDSTESVKSLKEFEDWLEKACNRRLHLIVTIGGAVLGGLYATSVESKLRGVFMGYSYAFGWIFTLLYFYAFVYALLIVVLLSAKLRRYDLKLFAADPSSSQVVLLLSVALNSIVYIVAAFAAYTTLISALVGLLLPVGIIVLLVLWLPIIAIFVLNQTSLSSIIRRAKWKTLNEIQAKVEALQARESFEDKETMDAINRLMDYHDRVKRTRNSAIDLSTTLNFINSLLLPLLAFIIGNLSLVLSLFKKQP